MARAVGIDLGTTNSVVTVLEGGEPTVIANAEGDASRFRQIVAEYQKAPAVTRDRMYLETMQQIFANTTKLMIDTRAGNNLLYLPLDKLVSQTGTTDAGTDTTSSTVSENAPSSTGYSERERARDDRSRGGR